MIHRTLVWSLSLACLFNGCQEPDHSLGSNPDIEHKVQSLLSRMTLAEKIGQMTQVNKDYLQDISDIKTYALGSILSGGGAVPAVNDPEHWADMVDSFQEQALATRLQIPLIYGIDAVHGHNNVVGATIFPHNIGLGCANDPDLVRQVARATAEEVAATGIHWTFSPCIAVPRDERWGRHYEGFSESPERVKALGAAAVEGYQGPSLEEATSILACAKHYVGDGGVVWGTGLNGKIDRGDTRLDENGIRRLHLPGYVSAIQSGVGSIMASYNSIQGQKMHGNRHYLTDILKGELGFEGFVVSDWAGIDEIPGDYRSDIKTAINAGIDMVMVPEHYQEFIQNLTDLVQTGEVPLERIDDAVTRILRIKYLLGLFDHPYT
ncbi:MAG: beta-glucosidase, partial [Candidatus Neomarinimicrobiota bacterium]